MLDGVGTPIGTMQALLGHCAPEITREIYLHAIPESNVAQLKALRGSYLDPSWTQVLLLTHQYPETVIENKEVSGRGAEI